jgi:hypothetical protein
MGNGSSVQGSTGVGAEGLCVPVCVDGGRGVCVCVRACVVTWRRVWAA